MEIDLIMRKLRAQIEAMETTIKAQRLESQRYNKLRRLELVIMGKDGAQYLKGAELDKYLDRLEAHLTKKEVIDEALSIMNDAFYTEYNKHGINPRVKSKEADTEDTR
jgi:hypothetical protein